MKWCPVINQTCRGKECGFYLPIGMPDLLIFQGIECIPDLNRKLKDSANSIQTNTFNIFRICSYKKKYLDDIHHALVSRMKADSAFAGYFSRSFEVLYQRLLDGDFELEQKV